MHTSNGFKKLCLSLTCTYFFSDFTDHMPILLVPAYTPLRRSAPVTTRTVRTWPADSTPLQICLHDTRWEEYEHADLERFASSVLQHVKNCVDAVTVEKKVRIYPNTKPWMTPKVTRLLKERDSAFRSKDRALYSAARANLRRGIREAKAEHKDKIEDCFLSGDSRRCGRGSST